MGYPPALIWFYRRPCFWWAAAAVTAVYGAVLYGVPAGWWLAAAVVALGCLLAGRREAASLLAAAALGGILAAGAVAAPADAPPAGEALLLRAHVEQVLGTSPGGTEVLLRGEWSAAPRVPRVWRRHALRYGARLPAPLAVGDRVELRGTPRPPRPAGNPGSPSPRLRWLARGAHFRLQRVEVLRLQRPPTPMWDPAALRARARAGLVRTLSPDAAAITGAFLLGEDAAPVPEAVRRAFRDSGTLHLLVVSGSQVTLLLGAFVLLGRHLYRWRFLFWGLGLPALAGFHALVGAQASVSRAAVMGAVFVLALCLDREADPENCLGLAALALLAVNPLAPLDLGAQLSFAAVWALVRVAPALARALGPGPAAVPGGTAGHRAHAAAAGLAGACLAAHLATAPLLALHFHRATWIGLAANAVLTLLAAVFLPLTLLHTLLAAAGPGWLAAPAEWGSRSLLGWAALFAADGRGSVLVFPPAAGLLPLCAVGLGAAALPAPARSRSLAAVGLVAGLLLFSERLPAAPPPAPTARFFDVGQGDAALLESPGGARVLVDTGSAPPLPGRSVVTAALRALRVPRLDALVLSHGHGDHAGGLAEVLAAVPVRLVVCSPVGRTSRLRAAAAARGIRIIAPNPGDRLRVGDAALTVLGPPPGSPPVDENAASLVLRWDAGPARVLLPGDAGTEIEELLLKGADRGALRAAVLKVAHHGSDDATSEEWLRAVAPRLAVISCGEVNRFGHPAPGLLERLRRSGAATARTAVGGMVTARWPREGLRWEYFAPPDPGEQALFR